LFLGAFDRIFRHSSLVNCSIKPFPH
jgi:hypothetical protein